MGLKESGLRGSLRSVSMGVSAIPDSDIYQYDASDKTDVDPWVADVGDDALAVGAPTVITDAVDDQNAVGYDGTDDAHNTQHTADNSQDQTYYLVVNIQSDTSDFEPFYGAESSGNRHYIAAQDSGYTVGVGDTAQTATNELNVNEFVLLELEITGNSSFRFYQNDTELINTSYGGGGELSDEDHIAARKRDGNLEFGIELQMAEVRKDQSDTRNPDITQGLAEKWGINLG